MEKEKVKKGLDKRYFGKLAEEYDDIRLKDAREKDIFERETEIVTSFLKKSEKGRILDVACGTGRVFPHYEKRIIYGVDISKDMLKKAKKRFPKAILKTASAEKIPYKNNMFSVAITSRFTCHTPYYKKAISEMTRVVKPGGSIIVDFPNKHSLSYFPTKIKLMTGKVKYYNLFKYSEVKEIAKENNLKIEEIKSKAFLPPRILPRSLHKITRFLNDNLADLFPRLSTPIYVRFIKLEENKKIDEILK